ncbi:MAG: HlyD family efflux transporter periplasmic adaptor subunit [Planctomycetaceae bacterium]
MHAPAVTEPARCPARGRALLLIPTVAFLLGIGAAIATARSRPEPYRGVYRQEAVEVTADVSGSIVAFTSAHGKSVKPGDPLATLENAAMAQQSRELTAQRDDVQRRLDAATANAATQAALRIDSLEKERLETRLRYADLLRVRFDVQVRKEALQQARGGSPVAQDVNRLVMPVSVDAQLERHRIEISDAVNHEQVLNAQVALCEERLARLDSLKDGIPSQVERSLGIDRLRSDLVAINAKLAEIEAGDKSTEILSPAYGRVGIYRRKVGEFAAAGETLVEVFDAERPYILLTVPISELAVLTPGREVRVEFEGIETRKPLKGVVADVASEAERNADAAVAPGTVVAQVRVKPVGRIWPTPPPGATADIHLEDRHEK